MARVKKRFTIALDIAEPGSNREFTVVEGDNGTELNIVLTDDGAPVDLTGCRVIAVFSKTNGTACQDSAAEDGGVTLCGLLNNEVDIALFGGSIAPGMVECELQIYSDAELSTLVTTAKFNFACRASMLCGDTIASMAEMPVLTALIDRAAAASALAETAAASANSAAAQCAQTVEGRLSTFRIIRYRQEE